MTEQLLACPFCGGKADYCETNAWWVRCNECNAETEAGMSPEAAAEIWNSRTPPPSTHVAGDDAARYRWLRAHYEDVFAVNSEGDLVVQVKAIGSTDEDGAKLDAAIDAARTSVPADHAEPGEHQEVLDAINSHNSGEEE